MKKGFITEALLVGIAVAISFGVSYFNKPEPVVIPEFTLGANQKLSELTAYTAPVSGDILAINDTANSATKKITYDNLVNILSSLFRIKDSTDTTKKVGFDISGVTTDTTRTWAFPDASDTFVGLTSTQTLTNKSFGTLLVTGSSTLQNFTAQNATTTNATSTNMYVSGTASSTNLYANSATIGNSTIGSLTVSSCAGCSSASGVTIYTATSSVNRYMAKTLELVSGDTVVWWGSGGGNDCGTMAYRISSPWSMATTTVFVDNSCTADIRGVGPWSVVATTTSTYTFSWQAGNVEPSAMTLMKQSATYGQQF